MEKFVFVGFQYEIRIKYIYSENSAQGFFYWLKVFKIKDIWFLTLSNLKKYSYCDAKLAFILVKWIRLIFNLLYEKTFTWTMKTVSLASSNLLY